MIKIIDFATSFNNELWINYQNYIIDLPDKLKENYVGLNPKDFLSFPVVIIDNKIVCFSGLQVNKEKWGPGIGRCSTRMWIHPDYRHSGKFSGGDRFLNTTYCLPLQLAKAKLAGLDCIFISRENNLKGFGEYLKLIKINCKAEFLMETSKYNVCGALHPIPDSCIQWVMLHHLNKRGPTCWKNNMEKYTV